jgi:hypothetical protein
MEKKREGKLKLGIVIAIILIIIIAGSVSAYFLINKEKAENNNQNQQEQQNNPPTNPPINSPVNPQSNQETNFNQSQENETNKEIVENNQIVLSASSIQILFQKSEYFTKLPNNAAILLTFFDGNGVMRNEKFFISGGGVVSGFSDQSYDLEFTMGDYSLIKLEQSNDFCATLNTIKNQQDLRVSLKNVFAAGKYLYLKDCVSF